MQPPTLLQSQSEFSNSRQSPAPSAFASPLGSPRNSSEGNTGPSMKGNAGPSQRGNASPSRNGLEGNAGPVRKGSDGTPPLHRRGSDGKPPKHRPGSGTVASSPGSGAFTSSPESGAVASSPLGPTSFTPDVLLAAVEPFGAQMLELQKLNGFRGRIGYSPTRNRQCHMYIITERPNARSAPLKRVFLRLAPCCDKHERSIAAHKL